MTVAFWDSIGICGGLSQTILYSTDRGNSWNIAQSGFFGGGFWGSCMLSPDIGFVIGENSIFQPLFGKSINAGQTWDYTSFYLNSNEGRAYSLQFTDLLNGYAACRVWDGRGAVAKTTDGGITWNSSFFNAPLYGVHFPISNASLIGFAVGVSGQILKSVDAGLSWQNQTSGTSQNLNDVAFFDLETGYVVGDNGTILHTTTGGEPPVQILNPTGLNAGAFELLQIYPNPFNASVTIAFYLSAAGHIEVEIFNLLGEQVTVLINGRMPAGRQQVKWEAMNFPSGLYLGVIKSASWSQTIKLFLLK